MAVKLVAVIALAVAALALIATASTAGAAPAAPHQRQRSRSARHAREPRLAPASADEEGGRVQLRLDLLGLRVHDQPVLHRRRRRQRPRLTNVYSVATQYSSIQYNETFARFVRRRNPYPTTKTVPRRLRQVLRHGHAAADGDREGDRGATAGRRSRRRPSTSSSRRRTSASAITPASPSDGNPCTTNAFCAYHSNRRTRSSTPSSRTLQAVSDGACDPVRAPRGQRRRRHDQHDQPRAERGDHGSVWRRGWYADDERRQSRERRPLRVRLRHAAGRRPGTQYNQVINGHNYFLQLEYSNAADSGAGGCVPYLGGPVTAPDPLTWLRPARLPRRRR